MRPFYSNEMGIWILDVTSGTTELMEPEKSVTTLVSVRTTQKWNHQPRWYEQGTFSMQR